MNPFFMPNDTLYALLIQINGIIKSTIALKNIGTYNKYQLKQSIKCFHNIAIQIMRKKNSNS